MSDKLIPNPPAIVRKATHQSSRSLLFDTPMANRGVVEGALLNNQFKKDAKGRRILNNTDESTFYTLEQADMKFYISARDEEKAVATTRIVASAALAKMGRLKCEVTGNYYFSKEDNETVDNG